MLLHHIQQLSTDCIQLSFPPASAVDGTRIHQVGVCLMAEVQDFRPISDASNTFKPQFTIFYLLRIMPAINILKQNTL